MALDRSPDLFAHRFYVFLLVFCFSYSNVQQTKLASSLVNFWAHYNIVCLIWWFDLHFLFSNLPFCSKSSDWLDWLASKTKSQPLTRFRVAGAEKASERQLRWSWRHSATHSRRQRSDRTDQPTPNLCQHDQQNCNITIYLYTRISILQKNLIATKQIRKKRNITNKLLQHIQ